MNVAIRVHQAGKDTQYTVSTRNCKSIKDLTEIIRRDWNTGPGTITLFKRKQPLGNDAGLDDILNCLVEDEVLEVFLPSTPLHYPMGFPSSRSTKNQRLARWRKLEQLLQSVPSLEHLAWIHVQPLFGPLIEPVVQQSREISHTLVKTLQDDMECNLIYPDVHFGRIVMSVFAPLLKTTVCDIQRQVTLHSTLMPNPIQFDLLFHTKDTCLAVKMVDPIDDHLMELAMVQTLLGQEIIAKDFSVEVVYALITNSREWVWLNNGVYAVEMDKDILNWPFEGNQMEVLYSILSKFYHIVS
jgi:hypothetical protein